MIKYISLLLCLCCMATLQAENVKSIYVSTSGSAFNAGTRNRPFKSIEKARDEIRKLKKENAQQSFRVAIFGGKYFVAQPIVFNAEDSGTDKSPIVYEAMKGELVRIIGG